MPAETTPAETAKLFLLEDLDDVSKTRELADSDLAALRLVEDWIKTYVVEPHEDLIGRTGPVCPFLPVSLERKSLWLAPEHVAGGGVSVVERMNRYKRQLLEAGPTDGGDVNYNVIAVVFTDLPADCAQGVFDDVLEQLAIRHTSRTDSCSDLTTKATKQLRSTTRASDHSNRPCRFSS